MMNAELFKLDMIKAVRETITRCKRSGTVGMGADNLWQVTVSRLPRNNGPEGTNAPWVARQTFNEVIALKPFNQFVLP